MNTGLALITVNRAWKHGGAWKLMDLELREFGGDEEAISFLGLILSEEPVGLVVSNPDRTLPLSSLSGLIPWHYIQAIVWFGSDSSEDVRQRIMGFYPISN